MPTYLTEKKLGEILLDLVPDLTFIHDKSVPNASNRRRPDYRCEEEKLIIEFDGDTHYCKAQRIIADSEKDRDYINLGYTVLRIPYFVQMTETLLFQMFQRTIEFKQVYPHGFIDSKASLPADFCELGIKQFLNDLKKFDYLKDDIINSLRGKIVEKKDINLVLPPSLYYLIEE